MNAKLLQKLKDGSAHLDARLLAFKIGMELDLIQMRAHTPVITRHKVNNYHTLPIKRNQ